MSKDLSPHAQRLRSAGYKLTNARMTVLDVLEHSTGHITSAEILERVNAADSTIGRASVFRTLDLLSRLAIVRPTYIDSSITPNYVLLPEGHHHHIVCVNCHRTIEFEDCGLDEVAAHLEARFGVHLTGHLLEFYGLCEACSANREEPEN